MKKNQIHISDWHRILFGEVPATFYLELIVRALIIYLLLMVSMRAMGKRMSAQLSRNELAALISLAAAVGVPMMAPNRGLLPAIVIAIVVVGGERLIAARAARNQALEKISQGNVSTLISDSIIDTKVLSSVGLSQQELFAQLRGKGIVHTGIVERLYMEANGAFTLLKKQSPQPGLLVIPDADHEFISEFKTSDTIAVCRTCGKSLEKKLTEQAECPVCGDRVWAAAVIV